MDKDLIWTENNIIFYDDKNGNTYPSIAAIFKNGELLKAFYDENVMTSYSRYYKTCACALYSFKMPQNQSVMISGMFVIP